MKKKNRLKRLYDEGTLKNFNDVLRLRLKAEQVLSHNLLDHTFMASKTFVIDNGPVQFIQSHFGTDPANQWQSLKQWHFTIALN